MRPEPRSCWSGLCVRAALPLLRAAEWARIVNFSAHSTQRQSAILPAYTAAKHGVIGLTKSAAMDDAREACASTQCDPA